jgi:hypothetical protein
MTPARFAQGMTFDQYVTFVGSPQNLARQGFDIRRFSHVRPRLDWSGFLRDRYAGARLTDAQTASIRWLAAQPGGPAKVLVISEEWSSDCRRDVPYLARLADAGGLELRIFTRDGDQMLMKGLPAPAESPTADDFTELYRYIEYPAIYRKDRIIGHLRAARAGESADDAKARGGRDIATLLESPMYDVWAEAAVDEIVSALHERQVLGAK